MKSLSQTLKQSGNALTVNIYTDGSHIKNTQNDYIGFGAYCNLTGEDYRLSKHVTSDLLKKYNIQTSQVSNPTAEFLAFSEVLSKVAGTGPHFFTFYIDYIGVAKWLSGEWKAKKPYIIKIRNFCISLMKKYDMNVNIEHVKGHSGVCGNDEADTLAKMREELDEF